MIAIPNKPYMSPDDYLAWEEKQELRYEYVDGVLYARNEIYGMTGGTLPHNDIALNLYPHANQGLPGKCRRCQSPNG